MDNTVDIQRARRHRRVPWSPHAWGQALYLASGIPAQVLGGLFLLGLIRWTEVMHPRGVARLGLLWLAGVLLIFLLSPLLTRVHRNRPLEELRPQAVEILRTALLRSTSWTPPAS